MKQMKCRLCGKVSPMNGIITLENFPKAAQFLPSAQEFDEDISINLEVKECMFCGLVQLSNQPVSYFKDVITASTLTQSSRETLINEFKDILNLFPIQISKALDIGAGKGDFLNILKDLGFDSLGLEHNDQNVQSAMNQGLAIKKGYLLDGIELTDTFDFITCNNFLEHQPDVGLFLNKVRSLLHENGFLYISVPNLERIIKEACFYEFVTDHLIYFSKETLIRALELSGFTVHKIYFKNNDNDIAVLARKRMPLNVSQESKKMMSIVNSLKNLAKEFEAEGKRVSVWGAGHRALALMALADLTTIDYVIDSAPFKQGKHTPLLRKKIMSPDKFFSSKDCDTLIIMLPGILSKQVEEYLRKIDFNGRAVYFNDKILTKD